MKPFTLYYKFIHFYWKIFIIFFNLFTLFCIFLYNFGFTLFWTLLSFLNIFTSFWIFLHYFLPFFTVFHNFFTLFWRKKIYSVDVRKNILIFLMSVYLLPWYIHFAKSVIPALGNSNFGNLFYIISEILIYMYLNIYIMSIYIISEMLIYIISIYIISEICYVIFLILHQTIKFMYPTYLSILLILTNMYLLNMSW